MERLLIISSVLMMVATIVVYLAIRVANAT